MSEQYKTPTIQYTHALKENLDASHTSNASARLAFLEEAQTILNSYIVDTVREARAQGATWAGIGAGLGISKQAAQQRYGNLGS